MPQNGQQQPQKKETEMKKFTFKLKGKKDYTGRGWYATYLNGEKYLYQGVHLKYKAEDEEHALAMHTQLGR